MSILTLPFERRSIEDPNQPITAETLATILGGTPASSGVTVNERTALNYSALWAVVSVLARSVASLPCILYERTADGRGKTRAYDERLYGLLHDAPNEQMTATVFWETAMGHLATWGNAYAFIEEDGAGDPVALWPLLPNVTQPVRSGRQVFYNTWDERGGGRMVTLYPEQVYHVPGLGFDGVKGYSPIAMAAKEAVGLGLALERFGGSFFKNGTHLAGVLKHPGKLSETAQSNLRDSWTRIHSGPDAAWRPAILAEGMDWTKIGVEPDAAQFIESRKFQVEEVARIYQVPPHKLGQLDKATFSNIEHQSLEFVIDCLRPWLVKLEQEANRKLLRADQRQGGFFVEFLVDALLRGDQKSRYESYQIGKNAGFLSVNEIRALENMNPVEGGDEHKSLAEIQNQVEVGVSKVKASGDRRYFLPVFEDACQRLQRRYQNAMARKGAVAAEVRTDCRRAAVEYLEPACRAYVLSWPFGETGEAARRAIIEHAFDATPDDGAAMVAAIYNGLNAHLGKGLTI